MNEVNQKDKEIKAMGVDLHQYRVMLQNQLINFNNLLANLNGFEYAIKVGLLDSQAARDKVTKDIGSTITKIRMKDIKFLIPDVNEDVKSEYIYKLVYLVSKGHFLLTHNLKELQDTISRGYYCEAITIIEEIKSKKVFQESALSLIEEWWDLTDVEVTSTLFDMDKEV